ncbi:AAA family ATPase [Bacillus thuringiensis]|uniref:AAA family ATPase n=1 Tax=Bacillus thuringiensis TaxID=1428 RepID=UPI0015964BF8|nr:AAA family ATPase [Bacillus thuringiensis]HEB2439594.1 AAA family ATPase [Bacillus thuringiensis]
MEILYLWIRKYKNIKNQSFNFGGNYFFRYEEQNLYVEKNVMHIPSFFNIFSETEKYSSTILNVSAIAGENGTGKTNLLDFLKYLDNHNVEDYIVVYKSNEGDYKIIGAECYIKNSPVEIIRNQESSFFSSFKFIYLSNILDITRSEQYSSQLFNISTNFLIKKEGFEQFRASEFLRQITFAVDRNFSSLIDFKLPDKIICNLLTEISDEFLNELKSWYIDNTSQKDMNNQFNNLHENVKNIRKIHGVLREFSNKKHELQSYSQFIFHIVMVFWSEILNLPGKMAKYLISNNAVFDDLIDFILEFLRDQVNLEVRKLREFTINAIHRILELLVNNFFDELDTKTHKKHIKIAKRWKNITEFKISTIELFTDIYLAEAPPHYLNTRIDISSNNTLLEKFITYYLQSFMKNGYLHFQWLELSAGQVARLNIYSRLYYAMNRLPRQLKDVVIIIDEGELYYHPEWQRKWLWNFLKAISSVYKERRVQIIISTHSPFILSDLPSQNIIFLKKGENGVQVIEGLEDNQLTFASNINTLLSNSFFMNNGLVGEVAKYKINNLISLLNNKDPEEIRKNESQISKQIRYIGEPIIRNKLFNMLNNILTVDYLQVQRKLDDIEKRLNSRGI